MSLPQTSINAAGMLRGLAGDLADSGDSDVVSSFNSEASAEISFGVGVKADATYGGVGGVVLPSSENDIIKGVVVRDLNHVPGGTGVGDLGTTGLLPKAGFGVIRKGRVIVRVDTAVTSITPYTDRGWCRAVAGGGEVLGAWSNADDGSDTIDCTKQAQFVTNVFTLPDGTKAAILDCDFTNKP